MNSGNFLQQQDSFRKTATATPKSKVCHCKEPVYEPFVNEPSEMCAQELESDVYFEKQKVWGRALTRHYRKK